MVEEAERPAHRVALDPQGHLAQVHGQGVLVHRVDTVPHHGAESAPVGERGGFFFARLYLGQLAGDAAGGGQQEVAGAGGGVAHPQAQQRRHFLRLGLRFGQAFLHDGDQGAFDQLAHQLRGRVVGAGFLALGAGGQVEARRSARRFAQVQNRPVVQQALVHRAELLHVQLGIVHPPPDASVVEGRQGAHGREQLLVGAEGRLDVAAGLFAEELAVGRGQVQMPGGGLVPAQAEGLGQARPKVRVLVAREVVVGPVPQPGDAVVTVVYVLAGAALREEQLAFLRHHQEQHPVDEVEQLPVVACLVEVSSPDGAPQPLVAGMGDEGAAQHFEGPLHPVAELLPDPPAVFYPLVVVVLQQALVRLDLLARESGLVHEPVENHELAVGVSFDHGLKVELQVGGFGEPGAFAQQAQLGAVGGHPPQGFGPVEEVLDEGVGRALIAAFPCFVEPLFQGDDVDRRGVLAAVDPVRNGELRPAGLDGRPLVLEGREPEQLEELGGPVLPGEGGGAFLRPFEAPLEGVPVDPRVREGPLYLFGEASVAGESEVGGLLPLYALGVPAADPVEQVG